MPRQANQLPSPIHVQNANSGRSQTFPESFSRYARDAGILGVRAIDFLVRFVTGIREFSPRSDCILRVSTSYCQSEITLPDTTIIAGGDRILELHFLERASHSLPGSTRALRLGIVSEKTGPRVAHVACGPVIRRRRSRGFGGDSCFYDHLAGPCREGIPAPGFYHQLPSVFDSAASS